MLARLVPALFALASTASALEVVPLDQPGFSQRAVLAPHELLVRESSRQRGHLQQRLERLPGRAAARARARALLASGEASAVLPVLYLDGRLGDPVARAYASRRLVVVLQPSAVIAELQQAYGLELRQQVQERVWIVEPRSPDLYASLETAQAMQGDPRIALAQPLLYKPAARRLDPNDPIYQDGHLWHLLDAAPGIRVREVWDDYRGDGINIAINDDGVQTTHPDLAVRTEYSRDYVLGVRDANPKHAEDIHGTAVAGLAAARGNNQLGTVGVAFAARIIANRVLARDTLATDDALRDAMLVQLRDLPAERTWVSNSSWSVPDTGNLMDGPGLLISGFQELRLGLQEGVFGGRDNCGIVYVWAAGNGGFGDPNLVDPNTGIQDCTAFDGYLNRFTIPVASLKHPEAVHPFPWRLPLTPALYKAEYSESGPNLIISAPGGEQQLPQPTNPPQPWGIVTTDRTAAEGHVQPVSGSGDKARAEFDDPTVLDPQQNPQRPYENGDYIPPRYQLNGTSFAAPLVAGAAALMLQARPELSWRDVRAIMQHRGQDVLPAPGPIDLLPHDDWCQWRPNAAGLLYNNWYGFGAVDVGRFVYGGDGARGQLASDAARDEPGALRWPLYPPLLAEPLRYRAEFPRPSNTRDDPDLYAIFDAPLSPMQDLVPDGRARVPHRARDAQGNIVSISRWCEIPMPISGMPEGFRIDAVEITVELEGLGPNAYPGGAPAWERIVRDDGTVVYEPLVSKPRFQGPTSNTNGLFNWGDYLFRLRSPNGTEAILGRQRPGRQAFVSPPLPGQTSSSEKWTFTEFFHANETAVNGTWTLRIIDERDDVPYDPAADPQGFILADGSEVIAGNPPQARVRSVDLQIWGHVAYPVPRIAATRPDGLPLKEGPQTIRILGSGFARSQGQIPVCQVYWQPLRYDSALQAYVPDGDPRELPFAFVNDGEQRATLPSELLSADTPGRARLFVANPAIVVGRAGGSDAFDEPHVLLPTRVASPNFPETRTTRRMKPNPPEDDRIIRYSHRPTISEVADIVVPAGVGFTTQATVFDVDVAAGLPVGDPERLQVQVISLNQDFLPDSALSVSGPGGNGLGTYRISGTPRQDRGFAIIQIIASDGAVRAVREFRVSVLSTRESRGCGGGMGLALLVIPLAIWIIRRRRR
ncbi:MAG: S8 family serine peptidase [Planctomycetota bacterium]|nr:S8 family serine peptidase [Planctomycetota bacterium]